MNADSGRGRNKLPVDMQLHLGRCIRESSEPIIHERLPADIRRLIDAMDEADGEQPRRTRSRHLT